MFRRVMLFTACLAVLAAPLGWGQSGQRFLDGTKLTVRGTGVLGGAMTTDSVALIPRVDIQGNAQVIDVDRDRNAWLMWTNAINDTLTIPSTAQPINPFSAESTATLNVSSLKTITVFIRSTLGGSTLVDSTAIITYALQMRGHTSQSQDSSSTYIAHRIRPSATVFAPDSVGHVAPASLPQTGEMIVTFSAKRMASGTSAYRYWNGQAGIYFTFSNSGDEWTPYKSWRIRVIGPTGSGLKPQVRVDVAGTPL